MIKIDEGRIMPICINHGPTEALARQLAELTGETLTEAIRVALAERYERLRRGRGGKTLEEELNEIGVRCARRPILSTLSDDAILGYDELGMPR